MGAPEFLKNFETGCFLNDRQAIAEAMHIDIDDKGFEKATALYNEYLREQINIPEASMGDLTGVKVEPIEAKAPVTQPTVVAGNK